MARTIRIALVGLMLLLLYLSLWPVPIEPVAWVAPEDAGLADPFSSNDRLRKARSIDLGLHSGPEDITGRNGFIYTGTADGVILRMRADGRAIEVYAETGGRPLGLEFDHDGNLLVANAQRGVQLISPERRVTSLIAEWSPGAPVYPNDVAVGADGTVYFTESSSKFSGPEYPDGYAASLLDILEHGGHGRVFAYDRASGAVRILMDGLDYANGIAVSPEQRFLLVSETGSYRILRYWLSGVEAGRTETVLDNLPGFPDNVNSGLNGRFWVGLVAPRNRLVDRLAAYPWLRKVVQRLPRVLRPRARSASHVIGIDGDGRVLMDLQDSAASLPSLTGVYETRDALYLSTLFGNRMARLDKTTLAEP